MASEQHSRLHFDLAQLDRSADYVFRPSRFSAPVPAQDEETSGRAPAKWGRDDA